MECHQLGTEAIFLLISSALTMILSPHNHCSVTRKPDSDFQWVQAKYALRPCARPVTAALPTA